MDEEIPKVTPEKRLSEKEGQLYSFFRESFRHSQGEMALQVQLFVWAVNNGFLKDLPITKQLPGFILDQLNIPRVHQTQEEGAREKVVADVWKMLDLASRKEPWHGQIVMKEAVTKPYNEALQKSDPELLVSIFESLVNQDKKYQRFDSARQGRDKENISNDDSQNDPRASFLRRYIILGEPVRHPIFQKLYDELKVVMDKYLNTPSAQLSNEEAVFQVRIKAVLAGLVPSWELNHPGQKFFVKNDA